mmetsp:Transcript_2269/g.3184  ORF Transcript_2269/g.3184 Transcript_2269/m.3184 type:complete len:141 (+) Transcript_2269:1308-1730(+)
MSAERPTVSFITAYSLTNRQAIQELENRINTIVKIISEVLDARSKDLQFSAQISTAMEAKLDLIGDVLGSKPLKFDLDTDGADMWSILLNITNNIKSIPKDIDSAVATSRGAGLHALKQGDSNVLSKLKIEIDTLDASVS